MNALQNIMAFGFVSNPCWQSAQWRGTTFGWDPNGDGPPYMGIVFGDPNSGREIFRQWSTFCKNHDSLDELRVSIIEGELGVQQSGYIVHLCPNLQNVLDRAIAGGISVEGSEMVLVSRVNRMLPSHHSSAALSRFREEYSRHGEFLLVPVTHRANGQFWVDVELGIVKHQLHFRQFAEVVDGDIDASAIRVSVPAPQ